MVSKKFSIPSKSMTIEWKKAAYVPVKGSGHTAMFHKGKVYIGGGNEPGFKASHRIDVYTFANNSWSPSPINTPYNHFAMTTLCNQLIIVGGMNKSCKTTNKIFSLDGDQLKEYTRMITPRCDATAAGYQGTLIVVGGRDDQWRILASTELYDNAANQWYTAGNIPSPHYFLHSVIVDNTLYLLGGADKDGISAAVFIATLDTLSSKQLKWSSIPDTPWGCIAPVSIENKFLIIIGGLNGIVSTREIYMLNKVNHSWEVIGLLPSARSRLAAVSVVDNKIIVIGGWNDNTRSTNTVWIGSCEPK